jgi:acyl-coenzyme A thioesterase PaaI-like protein
MMPTPEQVNRMVAQQFAASDVECVELGPDSALTRRQVDPDGLRPGGFISGPSQFAMADGALWYAVFGALGRIEPMALTSELSIRFLRPAQGSTLWARATIDAAGRRNVVGTVSVWVDDREDRPVSVAQGTYALPSVATSPDVGESGT